MCGNNKKCTCSCNKKKKITESILLQEKINLELSSTKQRELVKQSKIAHDALLNMYDLCSKSNINNNIFLDLVDAAFTEINKIITILVVQDISKSNETESIDNPIEEPTI